MIIMNPGEQGDPIQVEAKDPADADKAKVMEAVLNRMIERDFPDFPTRVMGMELPERPELFTEQEVKDGKVNMESLRQCFIELSKADQTEFYVWVHNTFNHCRIR